MSDNGPSASAIANSVLNSTSPSTRDVLPIGQEYVLEQLIRQGDQRDPKAGFSYLDNIANLLTNKSMQPSGAVLLDQLLGRPMDRPLDYGEERRPQPIPSNPHPGPPYMRRQSDIPGQFNTNDKYNLGVPDADSYKLQEKFSRRRT
jgi:hypothetical protein